MQEKSDLVKILYMDVTQLDLSQEVCDILLNSKIEILDDIVFRTEKEMLDILVKKEYLNEVKRMLVVFGLSFKCSKVPKGTVKTIEDLDLSKEVYNILKEVGIYTVEDLLNTDFSSINSQTGLNCKLSEELKLKLKVLENNTINIEDKSVDELDFGIKISNALKKGGIWNVKDLIETDILKIRNFSDLERSSFRKILLRLDELGFNPIESETKKIEKLKKSLEIEQHREEITSSPIEIENIEVNNGYMLDITFSGELKKDWIRIFKNCRSAYWLNICKWNDDEHISSTAEIMAAELIASMQLETGKTTVSCLVEELFKCENHKEVLAYFVEGLYEILKNTQRIYSKRIKKYLIKSRRFEIEETEWNIDFMKSVFAERDKRILINNELSDLIKKKNH